MRRPTRMGFLFLAGLAASTSVWASSGPIPNVATYNSNDSTHRFVISPPLRLGGAVYADDYPVQEGCLGVLQRRIHDAEWEVVWTRSLLNAVSASSAVVADDGSYVVTLGDWSGVRGGLDVVIYDSEGRHIKSLARHELLTADHRHRLNRLQVRPWWSDCAVDDEHDLVILRFDDPYDGPNGGPAGNVEVRIRLVDGTVVQE